MVGFDTTLFPSSGEYESLVAPTQNKLAAEALPAPALSDRLHGQEINPLAIVVTESFTPEGVGRIAPAISRATPTVYPWTTPRRQEYLASKRAGPLPGLAPTRSLQSCGDPDSSRTAREVPDPESVELMGWFRR